MAFNIEKLKNLKKQVDDGSDRAKLSKLIWKPSNPSTQIRIVNYRPNGVEADHPFIELGFYYGVGGRTYLAPQTFGKADPMQEYIDECLQSNDPVLKDFAKKNSAKQRWFVPALIRGEEKDGIKFWGFSNTIYKKLLSLLSQDDGSVLSLTDGHDVIVTYVKDAKTLPNGQKIPDIDVNPVLKSSMAVSPSDKEAMESIKNQPDITKAFSLPTYDELKDAIDKWLNPEGENPSAEEQEKAATAADAAPVAKVKAEAATHVPATAAEVEDEFSKFFKKA